MFTTFRNAWKIADLRKKLMFTLLILFIYRIGNRIPVPGVDVAALRTFFDQTLSNTVLGFYNTLSGSAFSEATILALSIQPYINASIIIQLLTIAIPTLERMAKEEGEVGKKKLERITRYTTVGLGLLMGIAYTIMLHNYQILSANANFLNYVVIVLSFTAGSALVMWLGEQITEFGIGNGISMILFASRRCRPARWHAPGYTPGCAPPPRTSASRRSTPKCSAGYSSHPRSGCDPGAANAAKPRQQSRRGCRLRP